MADHDYMVDSLRYPRPIPTYVAPRAHWRDQPEMYSATELAGRKVEALLDIIYPQEPR